MRDLTSEDTMPEITALEYTYENTQKDCLDYFEGDELAASSVVSKYLLRSKTGKYLEKTPTDMHHRLASEFARMELKFGGATALTELALFDLIDGFKRVIPQGSPMYGIGNTQSIVSLSNCVVVDSPEDDISSIMNRGKDLANLFKRRCGVGIDISPLRPEGMSVSNSAGTTTGAWSFADFYSYVCRMIGQNGRRGALMITIDVRHPDVEQFITMKSDLSKVTGANVSIKIRDDFMEAVEADEEYVLHWPVDSDNPVYSKTIRAREVWDKLVNEATKNAEPGLMMWDNILRELPAQYYADVGFGTVTTNPCFAGDTLIAVADGRNAVPIRQLADEGMDVPVYSVAPLTGEVTIQWARHPRLTGSNKTLVRVHLDDKTYLDVTPDHKFVTLEGEKVLAKDLLAGTSLPRFSKRLESPTSETNSNHYYRVRCNTLNPSKDQIYEHKLAARFFDPCGWDDIYQAEKTSGWHRGGLVVHHKDYNPTNNKISNLEMMTFKDHARHHSAVDTVGEKNGRYLGVTCEEVEERARELTQSLGRRFSQKEWFLFASANGLPMTFSKWRSAGWYENPVELARAVAAELGFVHLAVDPRTVRVLQKALEQGYSAEIVEGTVQVGRTCELCGGPFTTNYYKREQAYCNQAHAVEHHNSNKEMHTKRVSKTRATYKARGEATQGYQAGVYSKLAFDLSRMPMLKEWEAECKSQGVSYRLGSKFGFQTFTEVKQAGADYNHKVVGVEWLDGEQDVYNLTVDLNHTVGVVTEIREKSGIPKGQSNLEYHGIFVAQCGEIPLSPYDSCRLIAINLTGYVRNPWTSDACFDYPAFGKDVRSAQRMSDDLVELEGEKLRAILNKVDTEDERVLWRKMLHACEQGRRTGLGTLGLADTLASMGLTYATDDAIGMTDRIYEAFKVSAYSESVELAKERGPFPAFDWEKEKNCPFIQRLPEALKAEMAIHGRRNISLLTNAPTGTTSICAQTSSGIEPIYRLGYKRRKKINDSDHSVTVDYVDDMGDRWQEFAVYHHALQQYADLTGFKIEFDDDGNVVNAPDFFITSDKIDWERRVDMQAAIQKHIDHSISSTINLPRGTAPSVVDMVYRRSWKLGLKGVTVYVDGSRDGVLITNDKQEEDKDQIRYQNAPKRPSELICEIHHRVIKGEPWTILVGLLHGKPYEIFAGPAENIEIPDKYAIGTLIKNSRKTVNARYDLRYGENGGQTTIKNIVKWFEDSAEFGTMCRMVSINLRHGVPTQYLVEQLLKEPNDDLWSFNRVMARVLKKWIPDGTGRGKVCSECNTAGLVYQEGCLACQNCGASQCS